MATTDFADEPVTAGAVGDKYPVIRGDDSLPSAWTDELAGSIPAANVAVDDSGFSSLTGDDAQTLFDNIDIQLGTYLSPYQYGAVGDGVTDDAAAFLAWVGALYTEKKRGYIPQGSYAVSHVRDRLITSDVVIEAHPQAVILGLPTNDSIAGTSANTSAVATFAAGALGYGVSYHDGATEVEWTDGTEYAATGTTINWAAGSAPHGALAIGDTVRIWSRNPIVELGASTTFSHRIEWRGGTIDNSERGFFDADASGSGLSLLDFNSYLVDGLTIQGDVDYIDAIANQVTDSGLVITRCNGGKVTGSTFVGQADIGVYITGGALDASTDDSLSHILTSNLFQLCKVGTSSKRDARGTIYTANVFDRCDVGASLFPTTGTLHGGDGVISANSFVRCGRPIDVRRCKGAVVTNNQIMDSGYEPDGTTAISSPILINMQGVTGGLVSGNLMAWDELTCPATLVGIRITSDTTGTTVQTTNTKVTGNNLIGVAIACRELGTGTGNVWDNDITDATTYMDMITTRKWRYRRGNNVVEGYGSTAFQGNFTPSMIFAGGGTESITHTARRLGRYVRQGDLVTVVVSVEATITHSETTAQFRVSGLPFTSEDETYIIASGSTTWHTGINYPASTTTMMPEVPNNTSYVRFQAEGSGAVGKIITATEIPTGGTVRVDFTITYFAEPYADG